MKKITCLSFMLNSLENLMKVTLKSSEASEGNSHSGV